MGLFYQSEQIEATQINDYLTAYVIDIIQLEY
jgi:hypothetical protein